MKCSLYRHWDAAGALLYVGIALCPLKRLQGHKERSRWIERVAMITIEHHHTVEDAKRAERLAVVHEQPAFNKVLGPVKRGKKSARSPVQSQVQANSPRSTAQPTPCRAEQG